MNISPEKTPTPQEPFNHKLAVLKLVTCKMSFDFVQQIHSVYVAICKREQFSVHKLIRLAASDADEEVCSSYGKRQLDWSYSLLLLRTEEQLDKSPSEKVDKFSATQ